MDGISRPQAVLTDKANAIPDGFRADGFKGKGLEVAVHLGKKLLGRGEGKTKKEAEQQAARDALQSLKQEV